MSRVDYGTVELSVGDEVYTLTPTLDCVRKLRRWGIGSPRNALEKCQDLDPDTLAIILAAGAGLGQKHFNELAEGIHNYGVVNVMNGIAEFLALLLNPTGKEVDEQETKEQGE